MSGKSVRYSAGEKRGQSKAADPPILPNAALAVDVVLFSVRSADELEEAWQVLLVRSSRAAFQGKLSLPGVIVRPAERFEQAARRALRSKTGLDATEWYLEQLGTFGDPDRDSRARIASVAYVGLVRSGDLVLAPGEAMLNAQWMPVREALAERLAFDHSDMLKLAASRIKSKLRYSWVAFQLMPETFTLPELRAVYAAILDPSIDRLNTSNFKRAFRDLFEMGALVPTGQRADAEGKGRPGDLYRFSGPVSGTWDRELPWHSKV
jgi:ADP-ribose pyrophosphatase YjhB (NUDIX family)